MKKAVLLMILALGLAVSATAQDGMAVARLFGGDYRKQPNVTEVVMKGKAVMKRAGLEVFHSVTVSDDPALAATMEQLVEADAKNATDKEVGMRGGKMYYGFFAFKGTNGKNRYLFFRNDLLRKGAEPRTSVVYMEGKATMRELREFFKK